MDQLLSAIAIVSDPTQNRDLQAQAIGYLNTIRTSPEHYWQLALNLFVDTKPGGSRTHDPQIRAFSLQIIDDLLGNRCVNYDLSGELVVLTLTLLCRVEALDQSTNQTLRDAFKLYIRSEYGTGPAEPQAPCALAPPVLCYGRR